MRASTAPSSVAIFARSWPIDGREPQEFRLSGEHRFEHPTFGAVLTFAVDGGHAVSLRAVQGEVEIQPMRVK